jgi:hypothetical protein
MCEILVFKYIKARNLDYGLMNTLNFLSLSLKL